MTTHFSFVPPASRGDNFENHNPPIAVRVGITRMNFVTRHTLACFECYLHGSTKKNTEPASNSMIEDTVHVIDRRGACLGCDHCKPEETKSILGKVCTAVVFTAEELFSSTERCAKETALPGLYDTPTVEASNAKVDDCHPDEEMGKRVSDLVYFPAHSYGVHHGTGDKTGKPGRSAEKK